VTRLDVLHRAKRKDDKIFTHERPRSPHQRRPTGVSWHLLEIGNLEDTRVLALCHGNFTFETTSRGQRSTDADLAQPEMPVAT
jgi:hypothetical protein